MELWEDEKQIEQAIKDKIWEKYTTGKFLHNLFSYTNKNSAMYDEHFTNNLKQLRADWFITQYDKVNEKKNELLNMPKESQKPDVTSVLGSALCCYTNPKKAQFDLEFTKKN